MKRIAILLALLVLLAACEKQSVTPTSADERTFTKLTIAAAASLRELLEKTTPAFEAKHPGCTLTFSFEASSTLARQIEAGGGFDAFLSADAENVERIRSSTDPSTIAPFLSNRLALVVRDDLASPPASPEDLPAISGKLALAGPAVPAGKYARAYLTKKALLGKLEPRIVSAENVRATLALVESGAADAAFVYVTDARVSKRAKLVWTAAPGDDPGILYVAAALERSPTPLAAEYVRWLRSPEFLVEAEAMGFIRPPS